MVVFIWVTHIVDMVRMLADLQDRRNASEPEKMLGLYAVGKDDARVMGGAYPGGGITRG